MISVGGSERCLQGEKWAPPSFWQALWGLGCDAPLSSTSEGQTGVGPTQKPHVNQGREHDGGECGFQEWFTR